MTASKPLVPTRNDEAPVLAAPRRRSLSKKILSISILGFVILLVTGLASALDLSDLRSKAEQGDASAQYELAMAYDAGQGVQRDLLQAAHWCSKAAEQGHAAAQNCIGSMYQFGDGVPLDEAAAAAWYEKAAAQNYGEAYTNLGYLYDLGKGIPQDRARAVELYLKGAEKGSLNAMLNVGVSYWKGAGVAADRVEASFQVVASEQDIVENAWQSHPRGKSWRGG